MNSHNYKHAHKASARNSKSPKVLLDNGMTASPTTDASILLRRYGHLTRQKQRTEYSEDSETTYGDNMEPDVQQHK